MKCATSFAALGFSVALPATFAANDVRWTYKGHTGAAHWAELDPGFATCKTGKAQSPVNIDAGKVRAGKSGPIVLAYQDGGAEVVNNGHTIQVNLTESGKAVFAGTDYRPVQFHFHTPSEERINGEAYPMVAHVVHKSEDGKLAVLAVLFRKGRHNPALNPIFASLPAREGESRKLDAPFDLAAMLPADRAYYRFTGSLTTPPCSEDVSWHVLKTPVEVSAEQIAAFRKLYPMNARPVQPLNGRFIELSR